MPAIETIPACYGCGETDPCLCETQPCAYCGREAVTKDDTCSDACQDMASEVAEIVHRAWDVDTDTSGLIHLRNTSPIAGI